MNDLAKILLEKDVFRISEKPFLWASGIKSPFYCDNRLLLSYPKEWELFLKSFCDLITKGFPECNAIAGVATAGIPHAAVIAQRLGLPLVYVRSKAKEHGKKQMIEGRVFEGARFLVIEDLVSTGKSSLKAEPKRFKSLRVMTNCPLV